MVKKWFKNFLKITGVCLGLMIAVQAGSRRDISGPSGSEAFGSVVVALPNGNFVVTDPLFDGPGGAADIGAVFLYRPNGSLISALIGGTPGDHIGEQGITILANGNYVIRSPDFDNGAAVDAGAVTWCDADTGLSGIVSAANSLVGTGSDDNVGVVSPLTNGNYVVRTVNWDNGGAANAGAITWCNGETGRVGTVSVSNSLTGSTTGDQVGLGGVSVLSNGNYVVRSYVWDNGTVTDVGAVTWGNGTTGITGSVSASNSLVGTTAGDQVGNVSVVPLVNGNYVVSSPSWDNGAAVDAGAVTWGTGATGITGPVTAANSLIGSAQLNYVGFASVTALSNGNYVVKSDLWDNGAILDVGAITWGNGATGITGIVSTANSLVGTTANDRLGTSPGGVTALSNGNYVVASYKWDNGAIVDAGAATWCNGASGRTGQVSSANSLIGTTASDEVGFNGVAALTNGNYVVMSTRWDRGGIVDAGAVTWGNGATGTFGAVQISNSLTGGSGGDQTGTVTPLSNGNYVVRSVNWDNVPPTPAFEAGAVTWGDGANGTIGTVSPSNSLVGTRDGDLVGNAGAFALPNGDYVVNSYQWNNGATSDVGAVTLCRGASPTIGTISSANSLIGSADGDQVGVGSVTVAEDGSYFVRSNKLDANGLIDAGAISFGYRGGGIVGTIGPNNSVIGSTASGGNSIVSSYNKAARLLIVGRSKDNIASIYYPTKPFDYDGDGRSDFSIYRSGAGQWWLNRSNDGSIAYTFGGVAGDRIMPGDYTGDGKTDVALWRPSTAQWFIQRSEDASFYAFPFGTSTDIPTPGDFDGDGKTDAAVFRPSTGVWFVLRSLDGAVSVTPFGSTGDVPAVADYDGDGRSDIAIYRPSNGQWWLNRSTAGTIVYTFGISTDKIMPGDYSGDGKADVAFWRPSTGEWFILRSEDASYFSFPFGISSDTPAAADFDGDGKYDATVFRASSGTWYSRRSSDAGTTIQPYGVNGDLPTPAAFLP